MSKIRKFMRVSMMTTLFHVNVMNEILILFTSPLLLLYLRSPSITTYRHCVSVFRDDIHDERSFFLSYFSNVAYNLLMWYTGCYIKSYECGGYKRLNIINIENFFSPLLSYVFYSLCDFLCHQCALCLCIFKN